jgi:hypothetical protein
MKIIAFLIIILLCDLSAQPLLITHENDYNIVPIIVVHFGGNFNEISVKPTDLQLEVESILIQHHLIAKSPVESLDQLRGYLVVQCISTSGMNQVEVQWRRTLWNEKDSVYHVATWTSKAGSPVLYTRAEMLKDVREQVKKFAVEYSKINAKAASSVN